MKEKMYLLKIEFDCNDSDYVYGLQVINQSQKSIIDRNKNKEVSFGSFDFGGTEQKIKECISISEITEKDYDTLKKLKLLEFGEGNDYWIGELLNKQYGLNDEDEEYEQEVVEDEEPKEKFVYVSQKEWVDCFLSFLTENDIKESFNRIFQKCRRKNLDKTNEFVDYLLNCRPENFILNILLYTDEINDEYWRTYMFKWSDLINKKQYITL